jgi:hypothetical protein
MSRNRHQSAEKRAAIKLAARQRVDAVWTCLDILCPDLALEAKKVIARKALNLTCGEEQKPPRIQITPAQVESIFWPNMQCINPRCPMLLFQIRLRTNSTSFSRVKNETPGGGRRCQGSVKLTGGLSASRRYVRTHQQVVQRPTVPNAVRHLEAAIDLREQIVREGSTEKLFQIVFVGFKAMLRLGSSVVIWFGDVLNM